MCERARALELVSITPFPRISASIWSLLLAEGGGAFWASVAEAVLGEGEVGKPIPNKSASAVPLFP